MNMEGFSWYWPSGWYWVGMVCAVALMVYRPTQKDPSGAPALDADGRKVKGPRRFLTLGVVLLAFLGYLYFEEYGRMWWWLQVIFWVVMVIGACVGIYVAIRSEYKSPFGRVVKRGGEGRNPAAWLAFALSVVLPLVLLLGTAIMAQNEKNQGVNGTNSASGTPTPGASTPSGSASTSSGTPSASATTPSLSTSVDAAKASSDKAAAYAKQAKASSDEAAASANGVPAAAQYATDAKTAADNAQKAADAANNAYKYANGTGNAALAAKHATEAAKAETDAYNAASAARTAADKAASAKAGSNTPAASSGDKGEGTNAEAATLFPADASGAKYADSVASPLKVRTKAGVINTIRHNGVLAAWTARTINVWVGSDANELGRTFTFFQQFTSDDKTNAWVDSCRTNTSDLSYCKETVNKIADFVRDQPTYLGLFKSSTKYNVHRAALGFSNDMSSNPQQEKNGWFLAFGVTTKTGRTCIGFNVGTAASGVNGGDMRPAVLTRCVKSSTKVVKQKSTHKVDKHTVKHVNGRGGGKECTKNCGSTPPQKCQPTHPEEHTGGPYHWSYTLCKWFKDYDTVSKAIKKDGGTAGAKQPVGDNHTSGANTGSTKTGDGKPVTEPNGSSPSNGGTGTAPGGSSNIGGNTETGGSAPTGPPTDEGGGTGNGTDPGGFH